MSTVTPSGSNLVVPSTPIIGLETLSSQPKVGIDSRVDGLRSSITENGLSFNAFLPGAPAVEDGDTAVIPGEDWEEVVAPSAQAISLEKSPKEVESITESIILYEGLEVTSKVRGVDLTSTVTQDGAGLISTVTHKEVDLPSMALRDHFDVQDTPTTINIQRSEIAYEAPKIYKPDVVGFLQQAYATLVGDTRPLK